MAGRNQHYIPQFLQRGFGVIGTRKPKHIWLYKKSCEPSLELIKDTGTGFEFYSSLASDGPPTLDDKITGHENALALSIAKIQSLAIGHLVDAATSANIVTHLAPRTAHIRSVFEHGIKGMINNLITTFSDPENARYMLRSNESVQRQAFKQEIQKHIGNEHPIRVIGLPDDLIEKILIWLVDENFEDIFDGGHLPISPELITLGLQAESMVRHGHNRALDRLMNEGYLREDLASFTWKLEQAPVEGAILPDCIALGYQTDGSVHPIMFIPHEELMAVVMPISSQKLLVGLRTGSRAVNLDTFNKEAACCSHGFYLAGCNDPSLAQYSDFIGLRSSVVIEEALVNAQRDILPLKFTDAGLRHGIEPVEKSENMDTGVAEEVSSASGPNEQGFGYQISFLECADPETAERIAAVIKSVTDEMTGFMSLKRLEGITFASDYAEALRSLDRGEPDIPPAETAPKDVGTGVAMAVSVMRDGVVMSRLVMAAGIGHALISDDEEARGWALHTLVHFLVSVAMTESIDRALPGTLLKPYEDPGTGWLFQWVNSALYAYVAARFSGGLGNAQDIMSAYVVLLTAALDRANKLIGNARLTFQRDGDLDKLLSVAGPCISNVLEFSAKLIGHSDSLNQDLFGSKDELVAALDRDGLRNWLTMFQTDLRDFFQQYDKWTSFEEFLAFNRHVERLLWQHGIFPFHSTEGEFRVVVSFITDTFPFKNHPDRPPLNSTSNPSK